MKKILSLLLVGIMIVSTVPTVFALSPNCPVGGHVTTSYLSRCDVCGELGYCEFCDFCYGLCDEDDNTTTEDDNTTTDHSNGTQITATGTKGAAYEVTVPAVLTPGQSGTVTASGTWAANQTLKVTAPTSVDLVNGSDKIPVGIEFAGIEEIGNDNGDEETATATVTVGTVDTSAFFGIWTGTLYYTVEMVTEEVVTFTVDGVPYQVEPGTTVMQWMQNNYSEEEAWEMDGQLYKIYESNGNGGGSLACLYNSATNTLVSPDYEIENGANLYWQKNGE